MKTFKPLWESDYEKSLRCSTARGSKKLVQWWWHCFKQECNYVEKWPIETKHKIWAVFCVLLHFNNLSGRKDTNMKALLLKTPFVQFQIICFSYSDILCHTPVQIINTTPYSTNIRASQEFNILKSMCVSSWNLFTLVSSSFSLYIGKLCRCSRSVISVLRPNELFFPPITCFFHSGRSWLVSPMPRMLAANVRPSAKHKNYAVQLNKIVTDLFLVCQIWSS